MLMLLLACGGDATRDSGLLPGDSDTTGTTDTHDTGPHDLDQDGVTAAEDCDDLDDRRYPGAEEIWDGVDNDCDQLVDGDGVYSGTVSATATTVYEGKTRTGDFTCTTALTRDSGVLDYSIVCPVTHPDDDERDVLRLIMGTELVLTVASGYADVSDSLWAGRTTITSQAGWDTTGDAQVAWTDTASARFSFTLNAAQLGMSGSGSISR